MMIPLIVILTCFSVTSCKNMISMTYVPVTSSGRSPVCAVDKPTTTVPMIAGARMRCASECTKQSCCLVHQVNDSVCQMYDFIPTSYVPGSPHCTALYGAKIPASALGTAESCSFPFTYDGQLYYSCAANKSETPSIAWCPLSRNVPAVCTGSLYGFTVNNETVNVTIQSSVVPLRSVNGWLTVMSLVDTSFPTGQTFSVYRGGFGSILSNFWLGLERIYQLTNPTVNGGRNYRLRLELQNANHNTWHSIEYDWFYLDQATAYNIHVSRPGIGDMDDTLNYNSNGGQFFVSGPCASVQGPQWQPNAYHCSYWYVFGPYGTVGYTFYGNSVGQYNLKVFRMMVKN